MKRILQIPNYMYPNRGGIEQVSRDIANALKEGAYEQRIICFNEDASDGDKTTHRKETTEDEVDGIPVTRCGCVTKIHSQSISFTYPKQLKQIINSFKPDIVIFHYPNPFVASFLLKILPPQTKLILYWHLDIVKQKMLRILFTGQNNRLLERADLIIATSPNYIDGSPWLQKVKDKCKVIPNCFNENQLAVTPEAKHIAEKLKKESQSKIICAAIGRNVPYKGLTYLVQASKLLSNNYRIYIAGKNTEALAQEAAGDPKIRLLGTVDEDTRKGLILAADFFCFPSITKNEAFGIALAEAMAFGKPAVTFHIPGSGVSYVCPDHECGIEVPNRDVSEYARAIQRLAEDRELRLTLGAQAEKRAKALFTTTCFKDNVLQMLRTLDSK